MRCYLLESTVPVLYSHDEGSQIWCRRRNRESVPPLYTSYGGDRVSVMPEYIATHGHDRFAKLRTIRTAPSVETVFNTSEEVTQTEVFLRLAGRSNLLLRNGRNSSFY